MIIEQIRRSCPGSSRCTGSRPDDEGPYVEREMALIKVTGKGEARIESLRLADIFRARRGRLDDRKLCFRMTGSAEK